MKLFHFCLVTIFAVFVTVNAYVFPHDGIDVSRYDWTRKTLKNTNEQPLPENIEHKNEKIETVAVAAVAAAIVINPSENQNLTNDGEIESDYMSDESSTDSSLTSESESEIVDNEDGSGLEHKSLKSKIGKIFGRKGCKKGRKGKKGCKKPKHCKRGRNGKCCKRGVDENGKCRKGFPGRIAERLVNVTKEKIENKVNKWADKITGNGKGTNGNQAQSNNSGSQRDNSDDYEVDEEEKENNSVGAEANDEEYKDSDAEIGDKDNNDNDENYNDE